MAKGLNKAERHAIKLWVRSTNIVYDLDLFRLPGRACRVAVAEMRKRGYVRDVDACVSFRYEVIRTR